ncbi:MAG TPA: hypothetical protein VMV94_13500 [Phycisphaerae bacterium]|nr:hypothetical protein [Phycisphaerae bacterium]
MFRPFCSLIVVLMLASATPGAGTVTLALTSPSNGSLIPPGSSVEWTITAWVTSGDNLGLAMLAVDLTQNPANPALFDIPPAQGASAAMACFDRTAGVSNPLTPGPVSGYCGTPVGTPGQRNLVQIGGAQNVFGAAFAGVGTDVNVDPGIGQGPQGQVIATGVFTAPSAPGLYNFSIEHAIANTLNVVNPAPQWSVIGPAALVLSGSTISFQVCRGGDANGDQALTTADIAPFVDFLVGTQTPDAGARCSCDMNHDGILDGRDVEPFVAALLAP